MRRINLIGLDFLDPIVLAAFADERVLWRLPDHPAIYVGYALRSSDTDPDPGTLARAPDGARARAAAETPV